MNTTSATARAGWRATSTSRDWRMFFGGQEVTTLPGGETEEGDYSPWNSPNPASAVS